MREALECANAERTPQSEGLGFSTEERDSDVQEQNLTDYTQSGIIVIRRTHSK